MEKGKEMEGNLKYPYMYKELNDEEKNIAHYFDYLDFIKILPMNYCCLKSMEKYGPKFYELLPRKYDIWVIGYTRSGTTILQEILYIIGTDFDYEKAASTIMDKRFPFLENNVSMNSMKQKEYNEIVHFIEDHVNFEIHEMLQKTTGKRFIKSHSGFSFLHPNILKTGSKVVFVARNFKDCFVSNFYFPAFMKSAIDKGIYNYWLTSKNNIDLYNNYFQMLKEGWERRNEANLLFLFYEEIVLDKEAAIRKIAKFLNKEITEQQLKKLISHIDFEEFKQNTSLNNNHLIDLKCFPKNDKFSFLRKGKIGGWKNEFTKELNDEINEWIKENLKKFEDFDLPNCWKIAMELEL